MMKRGNKTKDNQQKRCFHYTTIDAYHGIIESGGIKPSSTWNDILAESCVWFSSDADWEQSASRKTFSFDGTESVPLTRDGLFLVGHPPVRIEVDPKLINIRNWNQISRGLTEEEEEIFEYFASTEGSDLSQWHACFGFVPLHACFSSAEIWNGESWVAFIGIAPISHEIGPCAGDEEKARDDLSEPDEKRFDEPVARSPLEIEIMRNQYESLMDQYRKVLLAGGTMNYWR